MWRLIISIGCLTIASALDREKRFAGAFAGGGVGAFAGTGGGGYYGTGSFAGTGAGTGSYAGTGYGGSDDYEDPYYAPGYGAGFIDPYKFHQQLTAQILAQHAAQNSALTSTYTSGDAFVSADASFYPDDIRFQHTFGHRHKPFNSLRHQAQYNRGYTGNRYAPSFASASGSIGPNGIYQSARIHPANSAVPNINNRFSETSGPGGYKGVAVSSFSASSDVDGKRSSHRGAITTVNDNGKVTSYKVDY